MSPPDARRGPLDRAPAQSTPTGPLTPNDTDEVKALIVATRNILNDAKAKLPAAHDPTCCAQCQLDVQKVFS